jgi:glycerol uptake operon antiterminator
MNFMDLLERSPIIAAVKDEEGLRKSFCTECGIVFVLYGNICNIADVVRQIKERDKIAIVHADLITGLSSKEIVADFIKESTAADGIISTRPMLVKHAMEIGLFGVLRAFIIDSIALSNMKKQIEMFHPDCLEVMPGVITKVIHEMRSYTRIPLIAGGLLSDKQEMMAAFSAGADAVSTTKEELWFL